MQSKQEVTDGSTDPDVTPAMRDVYREALRRGASTREELVRCVAPEGAIAHDTDKSAKTSSTYDTEEAGEAVERLVSLHLLQPADDRPDAFVGRSPHVAEARTLRPLRRLLQETQDRIAVATLELANFQEVYETSSAEHPRSSELLLLAPEDVNTMLDEGAAECRTDLLTAQPGGPRPVKVLDEALHRDLEMLDRGVRMRTIYQHSARYNQPTEAYAERLTQAGGEVRTLNTLFPRLIIFDRHTAFVPALGGSGALRIRQPALVEFLAATFETAWRAAQPFASAYETRRQRVIASDMQRSVARLLLQEDKDASIARHLGISERSCRQHIAKLMTQLGARNRTHLGYLIATEMQTTERPGST